jgi:glutamyl/glutaminyl-tRNA synthetase
MMKQQELDSIAETDVKEILQPEYDKLAYKLTQQNKAYNDFCKDNDLQPQYDRNAVSGWKAAQARQANAGAKRYKKAKEETP